MAFLGIAGCYYAGRIDRHSEILYNGNIRKVSKDEKYSKEFKYDTHIIPEK